MRTMKVIMKVILPAVALASAACAQAASCIVDGGAYSGEPASWAAPASASGSGSLSGPFEARCAASCVSDPEVDGFVVCDTRLFSFLGAVLDMFSSTEPRGLCIIVQ